MKESNQKKQTDGLEAAADGGTEGGPLWGTRCRLPCGSTDTHHVGRNKNVSVKTHHPHAHHTDERARPCSASRFSCRKEGPTRGCNRHEPWKHPAKWREPVTKGSMLCDSIRMECPEQTPKEGGSGVTRSWGEEGAGAARHKACLFLLGTIAMF